MTRRSLKILGGLLDLYKGQSNKGGVLEPRIASVANIAHGTISFQVIVDSYISFFDIQKTHLENNILQKS